MQMQFTRTEDVDGRLKVFITPAQGGKETTINPDVLLVSVYTHATNIDIGIQPHMHSHTHAYTHTYIYTQMQVTRTENVDGRLKVFMTPAQGGEDRH